MASPGSLVDETAPIVMAGLVPAIHIFLIMPVTPS
jgi:hypothetical protein